MDLNPESIRDVERFSAPEFEQINHISCCMCLSIVMQNDGCVMHKVSAFSSQSFSQIISQKRTVALSIDVLHCFQDNTMPIVSENHQTLTLMVFCRTVDLSGDL